MQAEAGMQHAAAAVDAQAQAQAAAAATGPPDAAATAPARAFHSRALGRPKSFDGRETSWRGFRFGITAYAGAMETTLADAMATSGTCTEDMVRNETLDPYRRQLSTQMYHMLALSWTGPDVALVEDASSWSHACSTIGSVATVGRPAARTCLLKEMIVRLRSRAATPSAEPSKRPTDHQRIHNTTRLNKRFSHCRQRTCSNKLRRQIELSCLFDKGDSETFSRFCAFLDLIFEFFL